jgi:hypothetical protein
MYIHMKPSPSGSVLCVGVKRGVWGQNPKPEHKGSVPGLLCQMTMVGGGGWWWGCSKGGAFTNASGGKRLGAKNPKPNQRGSVSGLPC